MRRLLGHPDPAALASLRAGLAGPRRARRLSAHVARCPRCTITCVRLDQAGSLLASAPVPSIPAATEQRILAALALESAARVRQAGWGPDSGPTRGRPGGPHRRPHPARLARPRVLVPAMASLIVMCAGGAYAMSGHYGTASGRPSLSASTRPQQVGGLGRQPESRAPRTAFVVTDTGTRYRKATLGSQVRDRLAAQATAPMMRPGQPASAPAAPPSVMPSAPPTTPAPTILASTAGSAPPSTGATPSRSLVGCVMRLTGDVPPELVDRATYQSQPVYVIAVPGQAWVVGIACTAARPALITSVHLGEAP